MIKWESDRWNNYCFAHPYEDKEYLLQASTKGLWGGLSGTLGWEFFEPCESLQEARDLAEELFGE